ncbi:MAG: hypothetical protein JOZ64_08365 [Solirubrobacterales bacterium]|nr:hypothetical protein [Solirubrobacterales bacterium]
MKLLVVTSQPITAARLRDVLPGEVDPRQAEVMVVAPALQPSGFKFWLSDADEAIARAQEVSSETVEQLGEAGVRATGDTGESDPVQAIEDALSTFRADRIVIFTAGKGYREDFDAAELRQRFGIPVDRF